MSLDRSVEPHASAPYPLEPSLAPVFGARLDRAPRADSTRDLLTTVLGEFVLPHGGAAWTQTLTAALELVDVRDKAARQALARLEDRGWLERRRDGRRTQWHLTRVSTDLLTRGADRIYGFGGRRRAWDGRWLMLLVSVPERDRAARYRMSVGLQWAGFGSPGSALWLSPWTDDESVAEELLERLGVAGTSFRVEPGAIGSVGELVRAAWDLDALRADYDAFLRDTDGLAAAPSFEPAEAARELIGLVHRWRRFPFLDPELPASVLPDDWPGPTAAARFASVRRHLLDSATEWWRRTEVAHAPASDDEESTT